MKKLISSVLIGAMLLSVTSSVISAEETGTVNGLSLTSVSHLKLDRDAGYVDMIDGAITVADLKANFEGEITVTGADGKAKADEAYVATDDTVSAGEDSLKALIYGDADRNGSITITDATAMLKRIANWENIDISEEAADVKVDGKVSIDDVMKLLKSIAKWEDISLGDVRMVFENKEETAEHEDSTIDIRFTSTMNKLGRDQIDLVGDEYSYKIKLAKNESESCQVLLVPTESKEGLTAELSTFTSEYGDATLETELASMYYFDHNLITEVDGRTAGELHEANAWYGGYVPEIVLPMADSFELTADRMYGMMITVTSTKDTSAGLYKATLDIKDADGNVIKTASVYAYVWDFTLSDTPSCASLFNVASYGDQKLDYFEFMLDYNLSDYILPVDITSDAADKYLNDPRITAFVIDGCDMEHYGGMMDQSDEETVASYAKLIENEEWREKGLFYYDDEPYGADLVKIKTAYEHLINILEAAGLDTQYVRNTTPLGGNNTFVDKEAEIAGLDPVEYLKDYINLWCPRSDAFHRFVDGGKWTIPRMYYKKGDFVDRQADLMARGDEIWWYICEAPEVPYANYFTWYQGVINRGVMWQMYFNQVTGQIYYSTGGWSGITSSRFDIGNGDGILLYPGEYFGFSGPQASWRLVQIRDGYDDYDYMAIAEELYSRDEVMKVVTPVSGTKMLDYTEDYRVMEAAREKLANMILAAQDAE